MPDRLAIRHVALSRTAGLLIPYREFLISARITPCHH
jgi:hypothetical protein